MTDRRETKDNAVSAILLLKCNLILFGLRVIKVGIWVEGKGDFVIGSILGRTKLDS